MKQVEKIQKIPQSFQAILWSASVERLGLERDKNYIIHQILAYGTLEQIGWLFKIYGKETIKKTFLEKPQNVYGLATLNFTKEVVLGLKNVDIKKEEYVQNISGSSYRRAKSGISQA